MTINLWHCVIINFTSLALQGVHNRLSLFKVLTQSHGNLGNKLNAGQPTTDKPIINQLPQILQTTCRNDTTVLHIM